MSIESYQPTEADLERVRQERNILLSYGPTVAEYRAMFLQRDAETGELYLVSEPWELQTVQKYAQAFEGLGNARVRGSELKAATDLGRTEFIKYGHHLCAQLEILTKKQA